MSYQCCGNLKELECVKCLVVVVHPPRDTRIKFLP